MRNVCIIEGCNELSVGRGWCKSHYYRWRRSGSPEFPAKVTECAVDGCDNPGPFTRGWCYRHYSRWWRTGSTEPTRFPKGLRRCGICDDPAVARGFCKKHYQRWAKHGDPSVVNVSPVGTCLVCHHPSRPTVELGLLSGTPRPDISTSTGMSEESIRSHARHLGWTWGQSVVYCQVCAHPDVEAIDDLLAKRAAVPNITRTHPLRLSAIAEAFGLRGRRTLSNHATLKHQQRRALYALGRLNALTAQKRMEGTQ